MNQPASKPYRRVATVTGLTILLMVVLRVAIGWHFLYEGLWKIRDGGFSSTPYLLASVGPFKDFFRGMVNDADGFGRMGVARDEQGEIQEIKPDFQKSEIDKRVQLVTEHYSLSAEQEKALKALADRKKKELDELYGVTPRPVAMPVENVSREDEIRAQYGLPATTRPADADAGIAGATVKLPDEDLFSQIVAYDRLLRQVAEEEKSHDPKYLQQRMEFNSSKLSAARNAILARVEKPGKDVAPLGAAEIDRRAKLTAEDLKYVREKEGGVELTEAQFEKGPLPMPQAQHFPGSQLVKLGMEYKTTTRTEWQDLGMMFGLCAIGACLILGLFTRLAALGAAAFLAMFYFSMPPWPGVPEVAGMAEGHYQFVNKNLIELIACLMLMLSRVGRWGGLDAFIAAIRERRRRRRAEAGLPASPSLPQERVYIPTVEEQPAERIAH